MSKRGNFSTPGVSDNPFASALASALQSKGLDVPVPSPDSHDPESLEAEEAAKGTLGIRFERRNGKPTTVVFTDRVEGAKPAAWASELKKLCSVGGSASESTIVLQGDVRLKVEKWAQNHGLRTQRIGG